MGEFQPASTVSKALEAIQQRRWVLPAIQREFVWRPEQVCLLFDSLLRGYPIGSFLLWQVQADQVQSFRYYEFLTQYHEVSNRYAPVVHIPAGSGTTAVLDGQQRLTALNIGLYGSHAERMPRKWATNPDAYPVKRLYLDLLHSGDHDDAELSAKYRFRFLTPDEAAPKGGELPSWFKVGDILHMPSSGRPMVDWLRQSGLLDDDHAYDRLSLLWESIHLNKTLNAYLEDDRDPNTVLDIFVRVNSGGTTLSYSDLLLSMATNQWEELDAREEVRNLVSALNGSSREMSFTRDNILKAALVLIDVPDIGFKVSSFTDANMGEIEKQWPSIKNALLLASRLLTSFGFTSRTLTANSVIIPLSYYLYRLQATDSYLTSSRDASDREAVRTWVVRSLLKRGIWGSGLDTLLNRQREAIRNSPGSWPMTALEEAMAPLGKGLAFSPAEVSELAELQYNAPRTFAALALLYPGLDTSQQFHEDHILPKSRFTRTRLRNEGVPEEQLDAYIDAANGLANLQLLAGLPNIEKTNKWPWEWLATNPFGSEQARDQYISTNDLDLLPANVQGFLEFYAARRLRIEQRLRHVLGVSDAAATEDNMTDGEVEPQTDEGGASPGGASA